jgi:hypothetical protein
MLQIEAQLFFIRSWLRRWQQVVMAECSSRPPHDFSVAQQILHLSKYFPEYA